MPLARRWIEIADAPTVRIRAKPDAILDRGYRAFYGERRKRDVREALRCYRLAADAGHPYAWTNLALCYLHGDGVARSRKKYFECLAHAARLGHDRAKVRVAGALLDGRGVQRDMRAGRALLERLARRGSEYACFNLGMRLMEGAGVGKDTRAGWRWHRLGARRGYASCENELGGHWHEQSGTAAAKRAARWFRRAARKPLPHAQHNLSLCYEHGTGVPRDDRAAVRWLIEAVASNHRSEAPDDSAWVRLARRHLAGRGVKKDRRKAVRLLELAARDGARDAKRLLRDLGVRHT